ncbi:MAG: FtsX-like permease family protein, partial [Vicinamibacterales bacterium]
LFPALRASRRDLAGGIRDRGTSEGAVDRRLQNAFITVEIALALAIASAAGLAIMTYQRLTAIDPGFDAAHVVSSGGVSLASRRYPRDQDVERFYDRLFERLRSQPGIRGAAAVSGAPMAYRTVDVMSYNIVPEGRAVEPGQPAPNARFRIVSDDYFRVVDTRLLEGRAFGPQDDASSPLVAIVNETMAKMLWPDGALGRRFTLRTRVGRRDADAINGSDGPPITVVGVVADAVQVNLLTAPIRQEFYLPVRQRLADARGLTIVARGSGAPSLTIAALRRVINSIDREQALIDVAPLADRVHDALGPSRLAMLLLLVFGGFGIALAAIGVYALLSYTVVQRTREIGVRLAIGARPIDIMRLVAGESLWPAAGGVVGGVCVSLLTARTIGSVLYGVSPTDWRVLGAVSILLLLIAACAAFVPAHRATRVDPVTALSRS